MDTIKVNEQMHEAGESLRVAADTLKSSSSSFSETMADNKIDWKWLRPMEIKNSRAFSRVSILA